MPASPEIEELLGKAFKHEPPVELVACLGAAYRDFRIEQLRDVIRIAYAVGAMSVQEPSDCSNRLMDNSALLESQSLEVLPPDLTIAYIALARRVAAIDAILRCEQSDRFCLENIRKEAEAAMLAIEKAETIQLVIKPTSDSDFNTADHP